VKGDVADGGFVAVDWMNIDLTSRVIYGALTLFAIYIGWRGWRAYQNLHGQPHNWRDAYIDDVGFTLIALFDGFVIVTAIDAGAPIWLVIVIGILGIVAGRFGVRKSKLHAAAS
jgi:hypothetical protein